MRRVAPVWAVVFVGALALATDPVTLRSLFPKEADVYAAGSGLVSLDLPPEVIAECLPGLADVRLFDPSGAEVPFLLDAPRVETLTTRERAEAPVLEARREELPRDRRSPQARRETFEIRGPAKAPVAGEWQLVMEIAQQRFTASARVTWMRTAPERAAERSGTIFRLTSPRRVEKLGIPLAGEPLGRLTVVLAHTEPYWLEPSFHLESVQSFDRDRDSAIPLAIVSAKSESGRTVVTLSRPRGVVPTRLRLASSTETFDRQVTVSDERPGQDASALGSGSLFQFGAQGDIKELELPVRPARGDRLVVTIEDGDSPPLKDLKLTGVFSQPSIVAPLASAGTEPAAVLRFGGGRAKAPRYDLGGFRPEPGRVVSGKRAEAVIAIYGTAPSRVATLGAVRSNPAFDRTPALAFAMRPGAAIDAAGFKWRRPLDLRPSPEGLARVPLTPEDLAVLRPDLADLRVVDKSSRQWPFLVGRSDAAAEVPLTVLPSSKNRATAYRLSSTVSPLTADRITVACDVPFFDRGYRLTGRTEDGHDTPLGSGRIARAAGDTRPIAIDFGPSRVTRLDLAIDDGDDAPLALGSVTARCPVPEVFIAAPAGDYDLLLGAADATQPRYELERARDVVLSVRAEDVGARPIERNGSYRLSSGLLEGGRLTRFLIWASLIATALVLGALTLRLARQGSGS